MCHPYHFSLLKSQGSLHCLRVNSVIMTTNKFQTKLRGMHEHSVGVSLPSSASDVKTVTQRVYQSANILQVIGQYCSYCSYTIVVSGAQWWPQPAAVRRADSLQQLPGPGQPRPGARAQADCEHREHCAGQHGHEGDQGRARESLEDNLHWKRVIIYFINVAQKFYMHDWFWKENGIKLRNFSTCTWKKSIWYSRTGTTTQLIILCVVTQMWTRSPVTGLEGDGEFDLIPVSIIQVLVHNHNLWGIVGIHLVWFKWQTSNIMPRK